MTKIMDEERFREIVREEITKIFHSDKFHFSRNLQIANGRNIEVGRSVGTMIGTSADQKIGFFGAAPVAQQPVVAIPSGGATVDQVCRDAVTHIIGDMRALGLNATT